MSLLAGDTNVAFIILMCYYAVFPSEVEILELKFS